ncbi:MAG TPA: GNAT family N-acetyltransferase [Gammaproteobacteria bacterium]
MKRDFTITAATWLSDQRELRYVREQVFMIEQKVSKELEWDGLDSHAVHLLARDQAGNPIGTVRMLGDGHVGRMAVLKPWRTRGVGSSLLKTIIATARSVGMERVFLDAQIQAIGFYERFGFVAEGPEFMDAGIPHRHMTLSLHG